MNDSMKWGIGVMVVAVLGVGWSLLAPPKWGGGDIAITWACVGLFVFVGAVMLLGVTKGWTNDKPKKKKPTKPNDPGKGSKGIQWGGSGTKPPSPPKTYPPARAKNPSPIIILGDGDDDDQEVIDLSKTL
jgi:hypothetical protein